MAVVRVAEAKAVAVMVVVGRVAAVMAAVMEVAAATVAAKAKGQRLNRNWRRWRGRGQAQRRATEPAALSAASVRPNAAKLLRNL